MQTQAVDVQRVVLVRLDPGDDLLDTLQTAVRAEGITSAVILSGVGSLSRYQVHVVATTNLPPGDTFFGEDGPYDILALTGLVLGERVHAHVTLSNTEKAIGGHLERGCRILTFAVVALGDAPGARVADWDRVGPLPPAPAGVGWS